MVEYLSGERIQGSSTLSSAPPQTSWKEIGRTTLDSAGDSINVTSLPAKDNIMILAHGIGTGSTSTSTQFNADTGANYTNRWSDNGGADGNDGTTGVTRIYSDNATASTNTFYVGNVTNISNQEKLGIWNNVSGATEGSGYAPSRREMVGKWSNTSSQISSVNVFNGESGDYASGAEVVVLGCDNDEADSGTNFWQELANVELTSTGDDIDSGTFTAKKYLWVQIKSNKTGSPEGKIQFNNDAGANYAERHEDNFGTDYTNINRSWIDDYVMNGTGGGFLNMFIINESSKEKIAIVQSQSNPSGNNAPFSYKGGFKWANTSAQITSIKLFNTHSGDWTSGSSIKVWGSD